MVDERWFYDQLLVSPMVVEEETPDEILNRLSCLLYGAGFVKKSYISAIVEREKVYPTAIPTIVGVAVPHTDSIHVLRLSMGVGILEKPISFFEMGSNGEKKIDVQIVMALAIPDPDQVVTRLQHLFTILQDPAFLPALIEKKDRFELTKILEQRINQPLTIGITDDSRKSGESSNVSLKREITVVITHPVGLHARPASLFVKTAKEFCSDIKVTYSGKEANAKSIINILQLGAGQGAEITIQAKGVDEEKALLALRNLVLSNFGGVE